MHSARFLAGVTISIALGGAISLADLAIQGQHGDQPIASAAGPSRLIAPALSDSALDSVSSRPAEQGFNLGGGLQTGGGNFGGGGFQLGGSNFGGGFNLGGGLQTGGGFNFGGGGFQLGGGNFGGGFQGGGGNFGGGGFQLGGFNNGGSGILTPFGWIPIQTGGQRQVIIVATPPLILPPPPPPPLLLPPLLPPLLSPVAPWPLTPPDSQTTSGQ